jgi:hypothetical protein
MDGSLRSANGGVRIRVTERGLPLAIELDERELTKPPMQLASEILLLCQLGAKRVQVARRRDLVDRGFSPSVIRGLNLSTEEELAIAEAELSGDGTDTLPATWMKPV